MYCGLRLQEVRALRATDLGVDPRGVVMFYNCILAPPSAARSGWLRKPTLSELRQIPEVDAIALAKCDSAVLADGRTPCLAIDGAAPLACAS